DGTGRVCIASLTHGFAANASYFLAQNIPPYYRDRVLYMYSTLARNHHTYLCMAKEGWVTLVLDDARQQQTSKQYTNDDVDDFFLPQTIMISTSYQRQHKPKK
ncbi:unnamed protein product, partial [Ectocarpus fasciculatus]